MNSLIVQARVELKKFLKEALEETVPSLGALETTAFEEDMEKRYLKIGVCPKGCMTFVGGAASQLLRCRECTLPRFNHCKYKLCRFKDYDLCKHRPESKTERKSLVYRPIVPLLVELLQTSFFIDYCAHALKFVETHPWHAGEDYVYSDFLSGREAQKHIKEMHDKFVGIEKTVPGCKEVSLLAADYYDGVKMVERLKVPRYFWPLFIALLSLPPAVRGKYGAGCFFWGFLASKPGSKVEEFLFRDCMIPELQQLEEGVHVEINGNRYYIQLRLIVHVYDTKAKEKIDKFQGTGSYGGCIKCMANPGVYMPLILNIHYSLFV